MYGSEHECLLAAFQNFIGRRGHASVQFAPIMKQIWYERQRSWTWHQLASEIEGDMVPNQIVWHHKPPRASHFGGLFKAAVRNLKWYVKQVPFIFNFTYDSFYTAISTWNAILNSRQLYPLTGNSQDLQVLKPAHFIVQKSLLSPPCSHGLREELPATKRLQIQDLQIDFWVKFRKHYLGYLQKQYRWRYPGRHLTKRELVLIKANGHSSIKLENGIGTWGLSR